MLNLKWLELEDKGLIDGYLKKYKPQISELTFTNLFAWRRHYKLKYAEIEGYLCLMSFENEEKPYMFPLIGDLENGKLQNALKTVVAYFNENKYEFLIKKVEEDDVTVFLNALGLGYVAQYDRDNSDYVYMAENLITLKGNKYHKKRNHVNKFLSTYEYEYIAINSENKSICYDILNKWLYKKEGDIGRYKDEIIAIEDMLDYYEKLDWIGAIIKVNGEPQAFTFGEKQNDETAVIHIEKINQKIDGLGEFINQKFCEENFKDMVYINREQDLGIYGLRKAKKSYFPYKLINKYNILEENKQI